MGLTQLSVYENWGERIRLSARVLRVGPTSNCGIGHFCLTVQAALLYSRPPVPLLHVFSSGQSQFFAVQLTPLRRQFFNRGRLLPHAPSSLSTTESFEFAADTSCISLRTARASRNSAWEYPSSNALTRPSKIRRARFGAMLRKSGPSASKSMKRSNETTSPRRPSRPALRRGPIPIQVSLPAIPHLLGSAPMPPTPITASKRRFRTAPMQSLTPKCPERSGSPVCVRLYVRMRSCDLAVLAICAWTHAVDNEWIVSICQAYSHLSGKVGSFMVEKIRPSLMATRPSVVGFFSFSSCPHP